MLAEEYIAYISKVRRYSGRTREIYSAVLGDFVEYSASEAGVPPGRIADDVLLSFMVPSVIRSYEVYLVGVRDDDPRTVNLHLSVLSGFCRWLMKQGRLKSEMRPYSTLCASVPPEAPKQAMRGSRTSWPIHTNICV